MRNQGELNGLPMAHDLLKIIRLKAIPAIVSLLFLGHTLPWLGPLPCDGRVHPRVGAEVWHRVEFC